ncbi:hypothetical protein Tco_1404978 [Tanacetum coccineum]
MEDSANITKVLANDFNTFIAKLNSDGMGDASVKDATSKPSNSFASVLQNQSAIRTVKIKELRNDEKLEGAAVAIPLSAVEENSWAKFGLKRVMLDEGFFLFQFETKEGIDKVMETGPWLIRLVPLILNVWTLNTILKKDKIKVAPVWVKLHHVPILAYSETGLSLITTQIGRPIMLDSYTSQMCLRSWGRNEYARALIEVSSKMDLMDSIVIAIPYSDGKGHTLATIDIEYEWRPPHCSTWLIMRKLLMLNKRGIRPMLEGAHQNATTDNSFKGASTPSEQSLTLIVLDWICCVRMCLGIGIGLLIVLCALKGHELYCGGMRILPWCILGDFNAALNLEDSSVGSSSMDISMREFKECVEEIELMDVPHSGLQFTWNQKPRGTMGLLKKLDRVMANVEFSDSFIGSYAVFQPYRISDHSPAVLRIPLATKHPPKTFKFVNVTTTLPRFKEFVNVGWGALFSGFHMYRVVKKLKSLKKPLRQLLYEKGNLHENVIKLRFELDRVQSDLDLDPFNNDLRDEEAIYVRAFMDALIMEERFLKQKSKVEWLRVGDSNSTYFHKSVKGRVNRNRIDVVTDLAGDVVTGDGVSAAFVSHYEAFLDMIKNVTAKEVKDAIFLMGNDKSPELNHTIIALIPKVVSPSQINDYRPISCCNVLFKCISKIFSNRIKGSLKMLISPNQSAFVSGRRISDNILFTQELMHNYHLDLGTPRYAFKVDIQKAYDTVDWCFLKEVLLAFGFHVRMGDWIMECVTTTSYSLCINDVLHGYFKGKRGLRQGNPLSPYLFTVIMEVLTLMLRRKVRDSESFTYHRHCSKLELVNLCFVDDLFLFTHRDQNSTRVIMEALDEFRNASGLTPSLPKSMAYFCNVLNHIKLSILHILPFKEGRLPVKYLGVPLISTCLIYRDCKELTDRIRSRIKDWKNKSLSAAGRLQLVRSVIGSMHVYWASVFVLPTRILLELEQLIRGFLWCQGDMRKGKAKVSWEVVCLPKNEGGLGLRRLEMFSKALMVTHIWNLLVKKESGNITWGWRKFLQLRPLIHDHVKYHLGDGATCSLWYDRWSLCGPLADIISSHDIHRASFSLSSNVQVAVANGAWIWPSEWYSKYPIMNLLATPNLLDVDDRLEWRDRVGVVKPFSVATVWDSLKELVGLSNVADSITVIVDSIIPFAKRRSVRSVIAKLVVAACSYFVWQECNFRLFKSQKQTPLQVIDCIKSSVRLKLLSCTFKKSKDALVFQRLWDLSDSIFHR